MTTPLRKEKTMSKKFDFEAVHKNKKFAFLDGALCGSFLTVLVLGFVAARRELKEFDLAVKDAEKKINQDLPTLKQP
jgi:hypothetical protein